ncbi:MAG: hypothetical protein WC477_07120 [Patescibacteria group bacterium]
MDNYKMELQPHVERIANDCIKAINETVPISTEDMPYAKQYVLEEVIKKLEQRV